MTNKLLSRLRTLSSNLESLDFLTQSALYDGSIQKETTSRIKDEAKSFHDQTVATRVPQDLR